MDKNLASLMVKLYGLFETEPEINVGAPEYKKEEIDALIEMGLIRKSVWGHKGDLSGWGYLISPTYAGQSFFNKSGE